MTATPASLLIDGSSLSAIVGPASVNQAIPDRATERWYVPVTDPYSATTYFSQDPAFPYIGKPHTSYSGLLCSAISAAQRVPMAGWYVDVGYSLPGVSIFPVPKPDPNNPNYVDMSGSTAMRKLKIPYFLKVQTKEPLTGATAINYSPQSIEASYPGQEVSATVNIQNLTFDQIKTINLSVGTVQNINGTLFLFLGSSWRRTTATGYQITYRWYYEPDPLLTPIQLNTLAPDMTNIQFLRNTPANGLPAYYRFAVNYDNSNPSAPFPYIYTTSDYKDAATGNTQWRYFPGALATPIQTQQGVGTSPF